MQLIKVSIDKANNNIYSQLNFHFELVLKLNVITLILFIKLSTDAHRRNCLPPEQGKCDDCKVYRYLNELKKSHFPTNNNGRIKTDFHPVCDFCKLYFKSSYYAQEFTCSHLIQLRYVNHMK